jgi:hypothetical protein
MHKSLGPEIGKVIGTGLSRKNWNFSLWKRRGTEWRWRILRMIVGEESALLPSFPSPSGSSDVVC